jgi:hypothetical protein
MPLNYSRYRARRPEVASSCWLCSQPSGQWCYLIAMSLVFSGLGET